MNWNYCRSTTLIPASLNYLYINLAILISGHSFYEVVWVIQHYYHKVQDEPTQALICNSILQLKLFYFHLYIFILLLNVSNFKFLNELSIHSRFRKIIGFWFQPSNRIYTDSITDVLVNKVMLDEYWGLEAESLPLSE